MADIDQHSFSLKNWPGEDLNYLKIDTTQLQIFQSKYKVRLNELLCKEVRLNVESVQPRTFCKDKYTHEYTVYL